mmetsp:Transcript_91536/g.262162  ORF Transcript_91536/g.262162 Transcript_91536/m.262162 type:complete len:261 (-) Transcript_91536:308-1090(-)
MTVPADGGVATAVPLIDETAGPDALYTQSASDVRDQRPGVEAQFPQLVTPLDVYGEHLRTLRFGRWRRAALRLKWASAAGPDFSKQLTAAVPCTTRALKNSGRAGWPGNRGDRDSGLGNHGLDLPWVQDDWLLLLGKPRNVEVAAVSARHRPARAPCAPGLPGGGIEVAVAGVAILGRLGTRRSRVAAEAAANRSHELAVLARAVPAGGVPGSEPKVRLAGVPAESRQHRGPWLRAAQQRRVDAPGPGAHKLRQQSKVAG